MSRRKGPPHPGMACCDLTQDLRGWLVLEYGKAAGLRALAAEARALGRDADARSLRAAVESQGWRVQVALSNERQAHHGLANAYAQRAMCIEAHAARVEAAHQWRGDLK
jgi:hypothetical protein